MRVERSSGQEERTILIGMIVDKNVLAKITAKWDKDEGMFASKWSNLIAGWAVRYFLKYNDAPRKKIQNMFAHWENKGGKDKDTVALVEKFLGSISSEYESLAEEINAQYTIDVAGKYFHRVRLQRLIEQLEGDIDSGDTDEADKRLAKHNPVALGGGAGVDLFHDKSAIQAAFETSAEALVTYPGALGSFFGKELRRDSFVVFEGPEKRGKTFCLLDVAWAAMHQRRKVAFFEIGDMSEGDLILRLGSRAARCPEDAGTIRIPTKIYRDDDQIIQVEHREKEFEHGLSWQQAWQAFQDVMERKVKSRQSHFRSSIHPNLSITVPGIKSILYQWIRDGYIPDVVIIDYADNISPTFGSADSSRDQVNVIWKQLRALSQELHCCLITATQTDAQSYDAETISMRNFSEDKRKMAHVTAMIGINQTPREKKLGILRYNWVVRRKRAYDSSHCVTLAGCLDVANPAILSIF